MNNAVSENARRRLFNYLDGNARRPLGNLVAEVTDKRFFEPRKTIAADDDREATQLTG